nr:MAG TPA: hypothetical protein [Caudoviricetes sp.]
MLFVSLPFVSECVPMGLFGIPSPSRYRTNGYAICAPLSFVRCSGQGCHFVRLSVDSDFSRHNTIFSFQRTL